ncbi:hypothetical protein [Nocardia sp. NBC_01327]|uniref:hypothetical protein n=1 Tax=Nocardia sp. NBC_01327 TaxID=2903593 RepID=UPI002E11188F|nr:hypothetical protein OG326_00620 [Nocardia sp. NBC_01327]
MTAIWFGLAAIALVGAIVLLYFDRLQRQRTGHVRQVWAKSQGYTYVSVEPALASTWRRGALAKLGYLSAVDVVSGNRKGEKFVLFDLEDAATLVAVRRQIGSDIDIDLRLKTAAPPKDHDLELLGAIGDRVVFATNPDIARHAVDQRMVAFIESLPDTVQQLWSEGNWTLGMLHVASVSKDWEMAIDAVLRLSGLLHVLPPVISSERGRDELPEPGRSHPVPEDEDYDGYDEDGDYDRPAARPARAGEPDDEDEYSPLLNDIAGEESESESENWRPALKVVPDPRNRPRRNWPPAPEAEGEWSDEDEQGRPRRPLVGDDDWHESESGDWHEDESEELRDEEPEEGWRKDQGRSAPPGGPFHPGFRPFQGPAPR